MKRYITEFIGTFFLVLVIGLTVIAPGAGVMAPLAIGGILMVMVYAGGHISGAHYNPAVTFAVWLRGKCPGKDVAPYMLAQIIGAALASWVACSLKGACIIAALNPGIKRALIAEFIFTFALVFVVLNTAFSKKTAGNSYYGLAIGLTLMTAIYAIGNISGGALNPAVAIGITVMGLSKLGNLWLYIVGNLAGGALAAIVFRVVSPSD